MKLLYFAAVLSILSSAPVAFADCESDKAEILKATAATAPIRRLSNYLDKGAPEHVDICDLARHPIS